ncbi:MAG: type II CAAX prenyl endopeptidase Rce1 family protein [Pyrinomonadaceae bacterium]
MSFAAANLAAAVLFALAHLPNWLWTRGMSAAVLSDLFGAFVLACFLGYLLKRTNSLWLPFGSHVANNVLVSFLR